MPSGNQNIKFSFQGDSSGLHQAVDAAIRDLEKYSRAAQNATRNRTTSGAMANIGSTMSSIQRRFNDLIGTVKSVASSKTVDNFNQKFEQTTKIVDQITQKFQNFGDNAFSKSEDEATAFTSTLQKVDDLLTRMYEKNVLTGNSVNAYATNLNRLNQELEQNAEDLTLSVTQNNRFEGILSKIRESVNNVKEHFRNMFKPFTNNAALFSKVVDNEIVRKLTAIRDKFRNVKNEGTETAGETASGWQKLSNTFGDVAQTIQRLIYKYQNYNRVQKEVRKNQQAHQASLEKLARWEANSKKGRQPNQVELLSENDIIDNLMQSGTGKGIGSALNSVLRKAGQVWRPIKQISSVLFQSLKQAGTSTVTILKQVGSSLTQAGRGILSFVTNANAATVGLRGFVSVAKTLPSIFSVIASQILQISFSNFLADATQQSIALVENLNLFTVAMGRTADEAQDFVDRMADLYGMNPSNLYRYAGYFAQITGAIGLTDEAAMKLSTSMTKMSNDIASLYNVEIETVVENLGSGLQGLNQAVRKYGIDMRQTTIQQTAYKYGLTENVRTMSEANRVVLRYLTMVEQMRNAIKQTTTDFDGANRIIGDFARNIETPANQLRIFKEQIQQLATAIGMFLIPIVQRLLPLLNGIVMAMRMILEFFAQLFGIDMLTWGGEVSAGAEDVADSFDSIGDAAEEAAKKVKDFTLPFDELHIFNEPNTGSNAASEMDEWGKLDPRLLEALEALQLALDEIDMAAKRVRDSILAIFGLTPDLELIPGGFIDNLIDAWERQDWEGFGGEIAKFLNQGIDWALEHITWDNFEDEITDFLDRVTGIFNGFIKKFDWYGLGNIGANLTNIVFHTIDEALKRVEWDILGFQFSQLLNGWVENVEWDVVGHTMGEGLNSAFRLFLGVVTGLHYDSIAYAIRDGLNSAIRTIEPEVFGEALGRLANGLIKILKINVEQVKTDELIDKLFATISRAIYIVSTKFEGDSSGWYALGNALTTGLSRIFEGLNAAIHKWGDMGLSDAIFDFLQGAIDGINADALRESIDNVLNGIIHFFVKFRERFDIREMVTEFVLWFTDVIKGVHVSELLGVITGLVSDIIGGIVDAFKIQKQQGGGNLIHEFFEMVENMFKKFPWGDIGTLIGTWVGELIAHIISFFTSAQFLPFVVNFAKAVYDALNDHPGVWQTVKDWIATFFVSIFLGLPPQLAAPIATFVAWLAGSIRNAIEEFFKGIGEWVKGFFTNLVGIIIESFGDLIAKLPGKLGEIGKTISDYGTKLRKNGHEMMDGAFTGVFESMDKNGPEIPKKFSKTAQEMIDEADKKFGQLPSIAEKHYENVSTITREKLSLMQGYLSTQMDEIRERAINDKLTLIVRDVEGRWHEIEATSETTWQNIYDKIKEEMTNSSIEVTNRANEIQTNLVNKIQEALSKISNLEWEETGIKGVKKLHGGFKTEWGVFEVYVNEATGEVIQLIENTLDNPAYSTLANNLTHTFSSAFSAIDRSATNTLGSIRDMWDQAGKFNTDIIRMGGDILSNFNDMMSRHTQAQQLASSTASLAQQAANNAASAASAAAKASSSAQSAASSAKTSAQYWDDINKGSVMYQEPTGSSNTFQNTGTANTLKPVFLYESNGRKYYRNPNGTIGWKWDEVLQRYTMAVGGVVTGPTEALIGEAGRAEAVIPLDQSPQMREFAQEVSNAVTSAISPGINVQGQSSTEVVVKVQIGEKDWDAFVYESSERGKREVGASPVEVRS